VRHLMAVPAVPADEPPLAQRRKQHLLVVVHAPVTRTARMSTIKLEGSDYPSRSPRPRDLLTLTWLAGAPSCLPIYRESEGLEPGQSPGQTQVRSGTSRLPCEGLPGRARGRHPDDSAGVRILSGGTEQSSAAHSRRRREELIDGPG
jgi:hypothetical protein